MEDELENIFEKAGQSNKYQYIVLLIFIILYGTNEYLVVVLPFLEAKPTVIYSDQFNQTHISVLNYSICEYNPKIVTEHSKSSLVTDLDIYCNKTLVTMLAITLFVGIMIGSAVAYVFIDITGRKNTLLNFIVFFLLTQISFYFIRYLVLVYIWLFFSGFFSSMINITILIYIVEMVSKRNLAFFITSVFSSFSLFGIIYAVFFNYTENWRIIFFFIGFIDIALLPIIYYYLEESPIFYLSQGNADMFVTSIKNIAIKNNRQLKDSELSIFIEKEKSSNCTVTKMLVGQFDINQDNSNGKRSGDEYNNQIQCNNDNLVELGCNQKQEEESKIYSEDIHSENFGGSKKQSNAEITKNTENKSSSFKNYFNVSKYKSYFLFGLLDLFYYDSQRTNCLTLCYIWMSTAIIFYGITIHIKNITGNIYTNSLILFCIDIIFCNSIGFISNTIFFGRKRTMIMLLLVSFCGYMICIFFEHHFDYFSFSVCLFISRLCYVSILCIIFFYSNEIYPTVLRTKGLGINSASAKLGGIIAPFIIEDVEPDTLFIIFCITNLLGILFSFMLPETIDKPLKIQIPELKNDLDQTLLNKY